MADVQNLPWGKRHPDALARGECRGSVLSDELEKTFHVSPPIGMDQTYTFRATGLGERRARGAAKSLDAEGGAVLPAPGSEPPKGVPLAMTAVDGKKACG